jgi:hypothetical protein
VRVVLAVNRGDAFLLGAAVGALALFLLTMLYASAGAGCP